MCDDKLQKSDILRIFKFKWSDDIESTAKYTVRKVSSLCQKLFLARVLLSDLMILLYIARFLKKFKERSVM